MLCGSFTYSLVVYKNFISDLSEQLLLKGRFGKEVKVMVGCNTDKGLSLASSCGGHWRRSLMIYDTGAAS